MAAEATGSSRAELRLKDLDATARLARRLARAARPGDMIGLSGDLGAGKTTLARAFLNALGDRGEVPSPAFTLVQGYDLGTVRVWHFDLFRLDRPEETVELGFEDALADGICLVEWPERLGDLLPRDRLEVALFHGDREEERRARLTARGNWTSRLAKVASDG
ncbi:MAG: tRNA (adenosine(37)-N6)-threonylcarbamoyltransferase complex ATPase subunit type 1 TsaE [Alphaproteobacteria bacterium]